MPESDGSGRAPHRARWAALVAALLVVMHAGFVPRALVGDLPIEFDSANYAYIGSRMMAGEAYLHTYNNKPPGIYWLYEGAFRLAGRGPRACKIPTLAADFATIALLFFLGRRFLPRHGSLLAVAIYSTLFLTATLAPHGFAEFPVTALALAGLAAVAPARGGAAVRLSPPRALVLGLALGGATLFKQPAVFLLAGALGFACWEGGGGRGEGAARWRRAGWTLAGWGIVVGALLAWLLSQGLAGRFWERVVAGGIVHGYEGGWSWGEKAGKMAQGLLYPMPLFWAGSLAVLARAAWRRAPVDKLVLSFTLPILAMAACAYEFYGHYCLPALPFLALGLAGWAVEGGRRARIGAGILLASQVIVLGVFLAGDRVPAARTELLGRIVSSWKPRPLTLGYQVRVAVYVRDHLRPGEGLVSTNSDIPFLADLDNAYRFPCIAPYIRSVAGDGLADFPEAASRARFFWAERWRLSLLPEGFVAALGSGERWREVEEAAHPEFALFENLAPGTQPGEDGTAR